MVKTFEFGEHKLIVDDSEKVLKITVERHEPSSESKVCIVDIIKSTYDGDGINDVFFMGLLTSTDHDACKVEIISKDKNDEDITIFEDIFLKGDNDGEL